MRVFIDKSGRAAAVRAWRVVVAVGPRFDRMRLAGQKPGELDAGDALCVQFVWKDKASRERRVGAWRRTKPALVEYPNVNVGRSRVC